MNPSFISGPVVEISESDENAKDAEEDEDAAEETAQMEEMAAANAECMEQEATEEDENEEQLLEDAEQQKQTLQQESDIVASENVDPAAELAQKQNVSAEETGLVLNEVVIESCLL